MMYVVLCFVKEAQVTQANATIASTTVMSGKGGVEIEGCEQCAD